MKNEVLNRYKKGDYINCLYTNENSLLDFKSTKLSGEIVFLGAGGCLWMNSGAVNAMVFDKGKWAEIIPTLTKKEAEEKLNCKIV